MKTMPHFWLMSALVLGVTIPSLAEDAAVTIDGNSTGRTFEGIGALSAGASSRLLLDYPEPQRGQILDLLFKPNFGASLHHFKVEIGGDVNSTDGTEPSHARTRDEFEHPKPEYFDRGYEWRLMVEAKRRNPHIQLDALQWGAPAWVGGGKFWSQDNADFIAAFIRGAKQYHGLDIDFCGLWNERPRDSSWVKLLRKTLDAQGLSRVRIIAADECDKPTMWDISKEMLTDHALADAVYAVGAHYPGFQSTPESVQTGKPLFASEDGPWRGDWQGACTLAKAFNRNYIQGKMTKTVIWSLISSYYDALPLPNSGPMKAMQPWSGHFEVQPALWAIAHTTQFAQRGWKYLDGGCGLLDNDGSYVTLRSSDAQGDYSILVETVDAKTPRTVRFHVAGGLSAGPLHVWRSNSESQFDRLADIVVMKDAFDVTFEPGSIYSLTTTTGQCRGESVSPPPAEFPCPYADDFESYAPGKYAKYFSDQAGVFEVANRGDGQGKCLRQAVDKKGIEWTAMREPFSLLGSTKWRNYTVSSDVRIESGGSVSLYGRVSCVTQNADPPTGYFLTVAADGQWTLSAYKTLLAEGRVPFSADEWHRLQLTFHGSQIGVAIDGVAVHAVEDFTYPNGLAGVGSGWNFAEFDHFAVQPGEGHLLANLAEGRPVRASSTWGDGFDAQRAADGDGNTRWNAAQGNTADQWLEIDLGRKVRFDSVTVRQFDTRIGRYAIQYADGDQWRDAATGDAKGKANWTIEFAAVEADKLRVLMVTARGNDPVNDTPSVYEIQVFDMAASSARK